MSIWLPGSKDVVRSVGLHAPSTGWSEHHSGILLPVPPDPYAHLPTGISLFTGAGGFDLGFVQAGWRVLMGCDYDFWATITYVFNLGGPDTIIHCITDDDKRRFLHGLKSKTGWTSDGRAPDADVDGLDIKLTRHLSNPRHAGWSYQNPDHPYTKHHFFGDIRELEAKRILETLGLVKGEVGCVFGGPPCQGFSRANGRRTVMDPRNSLVFEFTRLVVELSPKTMVMENVPGIADMVTVEGIPVIDAICYFLEDGGYGQYEALRQALTSSPNARAAIKGTHKPGTRKSKPDDEQKAEQQALF